MVLKLSDSYTTEDKKAKDPAESVKTTLSNDAYAVCEFLEKLQALTEKLLRRL